MQKLLSCEAGLEALTCGNDVELARAPLPAHLVVGEAGHGAVVPLGDR